MKKHKLILSFVFLAIFGGTLYSDAPPIRVNVYNHTNDEVYIYLDNTTVTDLTDTSIDKKFLGLDPNKYNGKKPYSFSCSAIDSGNLLFVIPDVTSNIVTGSTIKPSATGNSISGFIEFSYISTAKGQQTVYWDVSNVDNVGLLCGVKLKDEGNKNQVQTFGYNASQCEFLGHLIKACKLNGRSAAYGTCHSKKTPPLIYHFLRGPTICPESYDKMYQEYLDKLIDSGTMVTFTTDDLSTNKSYIPDSHGTKWIPTKFIGNFCPPTTMKSPDGTKISDVILLLKAIPNDDMPSKEFTSPVHIYIITTALNSENIVKGDSKGGVYVYADSAICDSPVNKDVNLNWVGTDSSSTTRFQQWCDTVMSRGLICSLNCGEISDTGMAYDNMDPSTYSPRCQKEFSNPYNTFIVNNSNSYGMAYSDAAHSKVQYVTTPNVTADVHIFGSNDPTIRYFYNTKPPVPLPPPTVPPQIEVNLAGGCGSLAPVVYDGTTLSTGMPVNALTGWHRVYFGDSSLNQWIWVKIDSTGANVSGGAGCFNQKTGNPQQPYIPQDAFFSTAGGKGNPIYTLSTPANCSWNPAVTPSSTPPKD
ncbi:MAG TPA: hypothetical protein DD381_05655 [Lentisphaeria bacterium]|nr:MAG: hypothetical protein A2X47_08445 [Lentisphaerae bacterium GWF2_38_69]HBM15812.1 hypothetical protein [Lentisphaeria bacterium]